MSKLLFQIYIRKVKERLLLSGFAEKMVMSRNNFLFIFFSLVLISAVMHSYQLFQLHFSPVEEQKHKISKLERQLSEKNILLAQSEAKYVDLQQELAQALPPLESIEKSVRKFPVRNVASISQTKIETMDLSSVIMERAKSEFRNKDYNLAIRSFREVIEKYPGSIKTTEAYFFIAESLFLTQKYPDCLDVVDKMMSQFPENELTGFIMLRMGQIMQMKNRPEEAAEVYRTVSNRFAQNHELKTQAERLEKTVE